LLSGVVALGSAKEGIPASEAADGVVDEHADAEACHCADDGGATELGNR